MFTTEDRIGKITGSQEFKGYEYMTGRFPGIGGVFSGLMKVSTLAKIVGWDAQSMVDGWNHLSSKTKEGKVFYNIYSDDELNKDPSKKLTGIAAFPLKEKAKFCVVCAGGGYGSVCSFVEAYPIIKQLNEKGYAAFSMQYRCGKDAREPNPMNDLAKAVSYIFDHAEELNVETKDYAVMGFSAGAHLTASFGTENTGYLHYGLPKPASLILSYPVITMGEKTHAGSKKNLIGKNAEAELINKYSVEKNVTSSYPASFIWQFDHDNMVPVDNSKMMADALKAENIPYKYITYPGTLHGAGLASGTPAEGWLEKAITFWEEHS